MAKHIYDKDGKYKGKILSDEEHRKRRKVESMSTEELGKRLDSVLNNPEQERKNRRGCILTLVATIAFGIACFYLTKHLLGK
ncbi:hypothetical protein OAV26_02445 [Crocinitomicaceae bacterium]|nr:hypothetical protein [Crocinitomicaceae bacterium]